MTRHFCDRCQRELTNGVRNYISFTSTEITEAEAEDYLSMELCAQCALYAATLLRQLRET